MNRKQQNAYNQGWEAAELSRPLSACPYKPGSRYAKAWVEGYDEEIDAQEIKAANKSVNDVAQQAIARIAAEHLGIQTLELRNSDSLDFREVFVANLKKALLAAYEAGRVSEDPLV